MNRNGTWQKPLFYESAAGGNPRSWNAELVNDDTAVKVIAGGDFDNSESFKTLFPKQINAMPRTVVKAGVEWMAAKYLQGSVYVAWRITKDGPPQLSHEVKVYEENVYGRVVGEHRGDVPHLRSVNVAVSGLAAGTYAASLVFTDVFNRESNFGYVSFQVS